METPGPSKGVYIGFYRGIYTGYTRIMEKKMETTIVYRGYIGNSGKENGNYYNGLYTLPETNMETHLRIAHLKGTVVCTGPFLGFHVSFREGTWSFRASVASVAHKVQDLYTA